MALIHYLYVGHFVPESGLVRFKDHRPFASSPINIDVVAGLLKKHLGESASPDTLPEKWGVSILPEYIVCDRLGSPPAVLQFAAEYAEREGALILDMGAFSLRTPEQLRRAAAMQTAQ